LPDRTNDTTIYVKIWKDIQPYTLPEASNAFFTSSNITFTEKKNTLKARYGVLWNKKIAYRHRIAYIEGQGIARNTHCPLCKDADSIGHILGSCTHGEVKEVYISRHDKVMRLIMKEFQNGSLGNFYWTADVGTAVAMEEVGADSKRLPTWLVTPDTMQNCDFSPDNKQKLRPDCMIVEITQIEIERAFKKRKRNGDATVPTQTIADPGRSGSLSWGTPPTLGIWRRSRKRNNNTQNCAICLLQRYMT